MKTLFWINKQAFDENVPLVALVTNPNSPEYIRVWIEPVEMATPSPEVQRILDEENERYKVGTEKKLKHVNPI